MGNLQSFFFLILENIIKIKCTTVKKDMCAKLPFGVFAFGKNISAPWGNVLICCSEVELGFLTHSS